MGQCALWNIRFFDSPQSDFGLSISPASMCTAGFKRFCKEVVQLPKETQEILKKDLDLVNKACAEKYSGTEYDVDAAFKDANPLFK